MDSLTDVLNVLGEQDEELEKEAAELVKIAEEHDAAGRITARGFMDELTKLSGTWDANLAMQGAPRRPMKTGPYGGAQPAGGAQGGRTKLRYKHLGLQQPQKKRFVGMSPMNVTGRRPSAVAKKPAVPKSQPMGPGMQRGTGPVVARRGGLKQVPTAGGVPRPKKTGPAMASGPSAKPQNAPPVALGHTKMKPPKAPKPFGGTNVASR